VILSTPDNSLATLSHPPKERETLGVKNIILVISTVSVSNLSEKSCKQGIDFGQTYSYCTIKMKKGNIATVTINHY
jgi:hypothetical protein